VSVRVRFAPSPTGYLHVGGARTALYNYLFARSRGGTFVLRIEDTDAARSTDESVRAILDSLAWLGLTWDEGPGVDGGNGPYFQSERREFYQRHAAALEQAGRAYRCYCTPAELDAMREEQARAKLPQGYDGRCRRLDATARARLEAGGRPPVLRFALDPAGETVWEDVVRGRVAFRRDVLDDFVLLRADGLPTYNFACVVDDHEMAISHVIRGDDHISNTPRQIVLYEALGWEMPVFAHVSMILGDDGSRLSKRHGATSVAAYRDLGYLPAGMVNFLALLGWALDGKTELFTLAELERAFRLERVSRNPAVFNLEKLQWLNGQHLKRLPEDERTALVLDFLARRGRDLAAHPAEWWTALVRTLGDRVRTLADVERLGAFALDDALEVEPEAWADLLARPAAGPWLEALADVVAGVAGFDLADLERGTRELAAARGIKPGDLMGAARVALTGRRTAPGLFEVMWLLGRERAVGRLRAAAARWAAESSTAAP
jgi:glutamyl-tRNA synthetase